MEETGFDPFADLGDLSTPLVEPLEDLGVSRNFKAVTQGLTDEDWPDNPAPAFCDPDPL